jgi:plasmid stability protein
MATVTVRNLSPAVVRSLKSLATRHGRSMEQELREIIERHVGDELSVLTQIEDSWAKQERRPTAEEIDTWIDEGRQR